MYVTSATDPAMMHFGAMGYSSQGIHNNNNPTHDSHSSGAIGHQAGGNMRSGTTDRDSLSQDILTLSDRAVTAQTPLRTSGVKRQVPPLVSGIYTHFGMMAKLQA